MSRLTVLGAITKWVVIPATVAAVGYYLIGPRLGGDVVKRAQTILGGAARTPQKPSVVASGDSQSEPRPNPGASLDGPPPPEVKVKVRPLDEPAPRPDPPRRRRRRRRSSSSTPPSTPAESPAPPTEPLTAEG